MLLLLESLDKVGILDKAYMRADQLSGGQQQRVALARTLTQDPHIILADEPVAALDPVTAKQVMEDFVHINQESDRCCACDLIVDRYVLRCVQILFFGDHHVENTVFDTQFLKPCFAMGLPGGDLVPGDFEVVMDPGDPADTERVIQHQLQRGNGVTLPPEGGIDHDAHIPPILFGCIMKIYITDAVANRVPK